jgi:DNA-binding NarL/FixJ family response regulator
MGEGAKGESRQAAARSLRMTFGLTGAMTRRQEHVGRLLAEGKAIDQVAAEPGLTVGGVQTHVTNARLNCRVYEARLGNRGR